jgi:serine protease AprX
MITYPNPSTGNTTLSFELSKAGSVQVGVYSITGRLVKSFEKANLSAGKNELFIEAEDLPTGTYIIKLVSGKESQSVKFIKY